MQINVNTLPQIQTAIETETKKFFRNTALLGIDAQGTTVVTSNLQGIWEPLQENQALENFGFIEKVSIFGLPHGNIGGMLNFHARLPETEIVRALNGLKKDQLDLTDNTHLRWHFTVPANAKKKKQFTSVIYNGQGHMLLTADKLQINDSIVDAQIVHYDDQYIVHILTLGGKIYEGRLTDRDINLGQIPTFKFTGAKNVNAMMTTLSTDGKHVNVIYGTQEGLFFNYELVLETKGIPVYTIIVHSEKPIVHISSDTQLFTLSGITDKIDVRNAKLVPIKYDVAEGDEFFAGNDIRFDNEAALLAINWKKPEKLVQKVLLAPAA